MPPPAQMRLRITRQLCESIDGIHLASFRRGYVYEVGTTIGNYLLAVRAAEPVEDNEPYIILPPEKHLFHPGPMPVGTRETPNQPSVPHRRAEAADRAPRRRGSNVATKTTTHRASDILARVAALMAEIDRIKEHLEGLQNAS
jgi:hypothetical protein